MATLVHAVMCGGSGTRLWPWSRQSYPKQFLNLVGDRSLLQATVDRLAAADPQVETILIGNEDHRFLMAEQLRGTRGAAEIVLEPEMRNTAAVALIAALRAEARFGSDSLVLLAPADHVIADPAAYRAAIARAAPAAEAGYIVTFGIPADRPETGYGYIERGGDLPGAPGVERVVGFREKPTRDVAAQYVESGRFSWNAGIFLFTPATVLEAAERLYPEMVAGCRAASDLAATDLDFLRLDKAAYGGIETISFDYAFAERLPDSMAVVPVEMGWSDVGSWHALHEARAGGDNTANVVSGEVELFDCSGTLAMSDGPLVVAQGIDNIVVIANHDAVYVGAADRTEEIKEVVAELRRRNRREAVTHTKTYRPWGWYRTLELASRFQVKEIVVYPGGRLSLQSHHHRSEHWIVVRGTARVTVDEAEKIVTENESVYIPLGSRHRLENPGRIPMHLVEVQTGSYLDEDDIVRYDDIYGRA